MYNIFFFVHGILVKRWNSSSSARGCMCGDGMLLLDTQWESLGVMSRERGSASMCSLVPHAFHRVMHACPYKVKCHRADSATCLVAWGSMTRSDRI